MSSTAFTLWLLIVVRFSWQNPLNGFMEMVCQKEIVGHYGQPSVVDCTIKLLQEVKDLTVQAVTWKKDGVLLLLFHSQKLFAEPGYSFAEPSWNDKSLNVSLRIANTSLADRGSYHCLVMSDRGSYNSSADLRVTAKYSRPSIQSTPADNTPNSQVTLTCRSDGGYPKGRLGWFAGPNEIGEAVTVAEEMTNGLFGLSSQLTLVRGHDVSEYTCVVFNATGDRDGEATFARPKTAGQRNSKDKSSDTATKVMAPLVVIGSLMIGLLLYLVLSKKCRARNCKLVRQPGTDPERGRGCPQDQPLVKHESQDTKASKDAASLPD
ncbi:cell adhesion molecule 3 isoform X3 [Syngnathoides biaculeatus]|uniref:cell adhesion molecule 3 isoform X3 n=1 Tax=Syngnathoides biaculeatus TaxID=300417 RepID=UPI002ADD9AE3|nr:cell adhesion molecule 3 isoform X3 [Syngnathoides biaculeatus]